jgi:hypothetical protein
MRFTGHNTQHIVVHSIDTHLGGSGGRQSQLQGSGVNTGHVASARRLVLLGLKAEGIHVDTTILGHVLVVLVGLNQVKVRTGTLGETVVTVELELSQGDGVLTSSGGSVVSVVEPVLIRDIRVLLDNPHELLDGVVEVQLDLVVGVGNRLITSELQLLDQVLVGLLGELATLISVQVDVIDVEGSSRQSRGAISSADNEFRTLAELKVDLNLVVLQSNQRQSQTRVAAEPELEGDIQLLSSDGYASSGSGTDHLLVAILVAGSLGQLVPDVEPITVVLVDTLTTDLELDVLDQGVTNPINPTSSRGRSSRQGGEVSLQIHAVDQITVAGDGASYLATEIGSTVEGLLDSLHREVSVTTVNAFVVIPWLSPKAGLYLKPSRRVASSLKPTDI